MAIHLDIGKKGEELAKRFLIERGYQIVAENWRYSRSEVDIIALDQDVVVFVEVKTRSSNYTSTPEEFVTRKKERLFFRAATAYMEQNNHDWEIRFDIISVLILKTAVPKITHLVDAFFPGIK